MTINKIINGVVEQFDRVLAGPIPNDTPPQFQNRDEALRTAVICVISLGDALCNKKYNSNTNSLLKFFKPLAFLTGNNSGKIEWQGKNYDLSREGGRYFIKEIPPEPSWGAEALKAVAGIFMLGLGGCDSAIRPFEADITDAVADEPEVKETKKGMKFCAEQGVVEAKEDCHQMNAKFGNKISTEIYLEKIVKRVTIKDEKYVLFSSCSNYSGGKEVSTKDLDSVMTFLLSNIDGIDLFFFDGNSFWPENYVQGNCTMASIIKEDGVQKLLSNPLSTGNIMYIVPDKDDWSARIYMRQQPNLCWAVYKTPCN